MKHLLIICFATVGLIATACVTVILFGRSRPSIDLVSAAGLNYCGTQVCFRGVALGTDWKNAMEKLTPNADYFGRDSLEVETPDFIYDMTLDYNQPVVGQLGSGSTNDFTLLLGDIVARYGPPCLVSYVLDTNDFTNQITISYPQFDIQTPPLTPDVMKSFDFNDKSWWLDPRMPIQYIDFHLENGVCATPEQIVHTSEVTRWYGFRTRR